MGVGEEMNGDQLQISSSARHRRGLLIYGSSFVNFTSAKFFAKTAPIE